MTSDINIRNGCPACGVAAGEPCQTPIDGVMTDWTHDARILAEVHADLAKLAAARAALAAVREVRAAKVADRCISCEAFR